MSDFEKWFKTTEAYKMMEEQNYFKMNLFFFVTARNQYSHSGVQVAYLTWQHQQAKINQHQLEIHALGEANLNQAMMLAKKQEEIDSLKAQLKKWKGQSLAAMLHGACQCGEPWESVVSDKEGFNQLHCFNCNHDRYENKEYFGDHEPKALRGEHE